MCPPRRRGLSAATVHIRKGEAFIGSQSQRQPFGLQSREVGEDCLEVRIVGDAGPDAAPALRDQFEKAGQERRHLLLNVQSCDYVDPEALALMVSERERLAAIGIDVMHFGASAVIRPLLAIAFGAKEEAGSRSAGTGRLRGMVLRSAEQT